MERLPQVLLESAITFDVTDGAVHCPMVHATVADAATKLILDSGSTAHVLTLELANAAGLTLEPGAPATDHAGAPVENWSLGEVPIEIEGCALVLSAVAAIDGPAPFDAWGVGGFLSPQSLHPSAFTVIDLADNVLWLLEGGASDVAHWLSARFPAMRLLSLARERLDGVFVRSAIDPFKSVPTMINTGSSGTEFAKSAVPQLRGARTTGAGFGVSGSSVDGRAVHDQILRVADAVLPIGTLLVRDEFPPQHGLGQVGMDVLLGTVVAFTARDDEPVLWSVPNDV